MYDSIIMFLGAFIDSVAVKLDVGNKKLLLYHQQLECNNSAVIWVLIIARNADMTIKIFKDFTFDSFNLF